MRLRNTVVLVKQAFGDPFAPRNEYVKLDELRLKAEGARRRLLPKRDDVPGAREQGDLTERRREHDILAALAALVGMKVDPVAGWQVHVASGVSGAQHR